MATVNQVGVGLSGSTGTGSFVGSASPTFTGTPILSTPSATSLTFSSTSGIIGTTTNDNAAAGSVGELISNVVAFGSSTSIPTSTPTDLTSIMLPDGDWNIFGNIFFNPSVGASTLYAWISQTSATQPDQSLLAGYVNAIAGGTAITTAFFRASLSSPTTIYLTGYAGFASGTCTQCGGIYARRVR